MSTEIEKQEKDLVVSVGPTEVKLALMENHRLIEFSKESSQGHSYSVGDVFLGRVKKVMPALNAAFVDIGDSKEAFIHYLDLGLYFHAFDTFVKKSNPNTDLKADWPGSRKGRPHREGIASRSDDYMPNRQRTDFYQRVTLDG